MGHISSLAKVVISAQPAICFAFFLEKLDFLDGLCLLLLYPLGERSGQMINIIFSLKYCIIKIRQVFLWQLTN